MKAGQHGGIVNQVTEDRQRTFGGLLMGQGDGIADAEALAEMGGFEDTHGRTPF